MMKNTKYNYGSITRAFHWSMALLFIGMFIVAYTMINIPKSPLMFSLYDLHKATGILLFTMVALRLGWRAMNVHPSLPASMPRWQKLVAKLTVILLYVLMFAMPMTGFLTSTLGGHVISFYGLVHLSPLANNHTASVFFSDAHELLSYLMMMMLSAHVTGSMYHHLVLRDNVLKSIWFNSTSS